MYPYRIHIDNESKYLTFFFFKYSEQYFNNPNLKKEKKISTLIIRCEFRFLHPSTFLHSGTDYLDCGVVIIKATLTRIRWSVR